MIHDRGRLLDVAFFQITGIPAYCESSPCHIKHHTSIHTDRHHGYEYAFHFGRHPSTTVSELPNLSHLPAVLSSATSNDIKSPGTLGLPSTSGNSRPCPYIPRQATPLDAPLILDMSKMGKPHSDVWVTLPRKVLEGSIA